MTTTPTNFFPDEDEDFFTSSLCRAPLPTKTTTTATANKPLLAPKQQFAVSSTRSSSLHLFDDDLLTNDDDNIYTTRTTTTILAPSPRSTAQHPKTAHKLISKNIKEKPKKVPVPTTSDQDVQEEDADVADLRARIAAIISPNDDTLPPLPTRAPVSFYHGLLVADIAGGVTTLIGPDADTNNIIAQKVLQHRSVVDLAIFHAITGLDTFPWHARFGADIEIVVASKGRVLVRTDTDTDAFRADDCASFAHLAPPQQPARA